jgi:SMC interacting uncharacterized protein involved in chromosome segregation
MLVFKVLKSSTNLTLSVNNLQREYFYDKLNINNNLSITGNINETTPTELSYLNNVTSDIQQQLNNKIGLSNQEEFSDSILLENVMGHVKEKINIHSDEQEIKKGGLTSHLIVAL